jgi:hypothetical protein
VILDPAIFAAREPIRYSQVRRTADADHGQTDLANPVKQDRAIRPVSNTMRRQPGAFANSPAPLRPRSAVTALRRHQPSRKRKQRSFPHTWQQTRLDPQPRLAMPMEVERLATGSGACSLQEREHRVVFLPQRPTRLEGRLEIPCGLQTRPPSLVLESQQCICPKRPVR